MDDTTLDTLVRDAHDVEPPAPAVVARERAALDALIAADDRASASRHRRRTPLIVGAVAAGLLGGVGAAAAGGLFDAPIEQMVNRTESECRITTDDAELVAAETDSIGHTIEYWVLDSGDGFGDLIVEKLPDGTTDGGSMGCGAGQRGDVPSYASQAWATAPMSYVEGEATYLRLYGQIPPNASAADVLLTDGTTVTVTADDARGYFLHLVTLPPISGVDVVSVTPLP